MDHYVDAVIISTGAGSVLVPAKHLSNHTSKIFAFCNVGCVISRIHMALRSYSVLDIFLPSIIIIVQDYSQALNI